MTKVMRSETELVLATYRTQLLNPGDLDSVKNVQAGYKVKPLSTFLGQPAPAPMPAIVFITPLTPETQKTSLQSRIEPSILRGREDLWRISTRLSMQANMRWNS